MAKVSDLCLVMSDSKGYIRKVLRVNNQDRTGNDEFRLEKFRFRREIGRN